jgi:hypothetical protein
MYCSHCGNEVAKSDNFCSSCGKKIIHNTDSQTFVKKTQREIEDLSKIVKESKAYQNLSSSSDSLQKAKKASLKVFDILLVILAIFSIMGLLGQFISPLTGGQHWLELAFKSANVNLAILFGLILGGLVLPLFLVYVGLRKFQIAGINVGALISFILLLLTGLLLLVS